jgi:HEXXH motif-containing protein
MTEAVVHELMHTKLNAMLELDPLLENAFFPLFASPVRPDPRPLHGVLLAVHAFLPVAELYRRMIEADHPLARSAAFRERHRVIARKNHDGATVLLANARPTEAGRALLDEIARLDARFEATRA